MSFKELNATFGVTSSSFQTNDLGVSGTASINVLETAKTTVINALVFRPSAVPGHVLTAIDTTGAVHWAPNTGAGQTGAGNVARVDAVYGNDLTGSIGGPAFLTIQAAITAVGATPGLTIWVFPGTYTLTAGITLPNGTALRGLNVQTCTVQMTGVTANTTLLTMGENCRVEDLTLLLTSSGHYNLVGIHLGGTSSVTAKLRTCVLSVNNSAAPTAGSSNVYGVLSDGTGTLGSASFSFNSLKGSTINVYSNGGGNKRGILINSSNIVTVRDLNVYVAPPVDVTSAGIYVGVETADPANLGSIQLRSATVGTTPPVYVASPGTIQLYTANDVLQTNPNTVSDPIYLASPGIQIGPGVDLVSKTSGGQPFSTYMYPQTIYWGMRGGLTTGTSGFMWPGTVPVTASGVFPDRSGVVGTFDIIATAYSTSGPTQGNITVNPSTTTTGIALNMPIVFASSWGPFVAATTYFVFTIADTTTIQVTATYGGPLFNTPTPAPVTPVTLTVYSNISITATAVNASNQITSITPSGFSMQIGYPIVFSNFLGYLNPLTTYYVFSVVSPTVFTVSETLGGPIFTTGVHTLTTASGLTSALASTAIVIVTSWASNGQITVSGTGRPASFIVTGMPVVFTSSFGGIVGGTRYWMLAVGGIPGRTAFQVTTTFQGATALTLSPGSGSVRAAVFTLYSPPAYYRIQQPFILSGLVTALNTPANLLSSASTSFSLTVFRTARGADLQTGLTIVPSYTQTYNNSTTIAQTYFNSTQIFAMGDRIHIYVTYVGSTTAHDLTVQLDFF